MQNRSIISRSFDTNQLPPREQFSPWKNVEAKSAAIQIERLEPNDAHFNCKGKIIEIGKIAIDWHEFLTPFRVKATEKLLKQANLNVVQLVYQVSGRNVSANFGSEAPLMNDHEIRAIDLQQAFSMEYDYNVGYSVFLNRSRLMNELQYRPNLHGVFLESNALVKVLKQMIPIVFREVQHASAKEAEILAENLNRLVVDVIRFQNINDLNSAAVGFRSKLAAVCQHIEHNYKDQDLTPNRIALELGLSKSTLYRVVENYGSPQRLIQEVRLKKAAEILRSGQPENIEKLAFDIGFSGRQVFARAFRREFGVSPSEYRNMSHISEQTPAVSDDTCVACWSAYMASVAAVGRY